VVTTDQYQRLSQPGRQVAADPQI